MPVRHITVICNFLSQPEGLYDMGPHFLQFGNLGIDSLRTEWEDRDRELFRLSLIHISEPTRLDVI
eukprot:473800-Prorocentrum_lima.AAC.1